MRPPTPRLRINSEDFFDNENGPPSKQNELFSQKQHHQQHQQQNSNASSVNNTNTNTANFSNTANNYNENIAILVADSDVLDISVL